MSSRAPRTLSLRELNRATLARQLLLERSRLPLLRAMERVAGLQGQWNPAPFVGLWSRLDDFRREQLERALFRQQIVKATLMRATLHLVAARDYPTFVAATHDGSASPIHADALALADRFAEGARELYAGGPRTQAALWEWLAGQPGLAEPENPAHAWGAFRVRGRIVHAPEAALWRMPPKMTFVAFAEGPRPDPARARVALVRRYLGAFGPSSRADIVEWSGLRVRDVAPAIEALDARTALRRFRDDAGRELIDLARAPLPPGDVAAPVRFLPRWDNVLLGHADRRRVVPDEHRGVGLAGTQTFLVDGVVAGSWAVEGGRVRMEPFAPVPRSARRDLLDEASRLEAFVR